MVDGPKYRDLRDLFGTSVRRHATKPLLGVREARGYRWLTYRDLSGRVDTLRAALTARGISPGDRIALIAPNSPEWLVVAFAAFTTRAVLVPIYPYQRYDDWLDILRDATPRYVFAYGVEAASAVQGWRTELDEPPIVVCMHDLGISGAMSFDQFVGDAFGSEVPEVVPEPNDVCQLIYTSGTTGRAKGVELTHRNIASNISDLHDIFPFSSEDRSLSFLPWAHAFGQVVELFGLISVGASLAVCPGEDDVLRGLQEVQPTLLFSVPRLFNRLYDGAVAHVRELGPVAQHLFDAGLENARVRRRIRARGRARGAVELKAQLYDRVVFRRIRAQFGGRVRYAVSGGAPLSPEVAEFADSVGITLYEGYGLTEASPIVSTNWPGARRLGSVGKPLQSVRVLVDHGQGESRRDGEIVVYGPNVMRGYYKQPEETARVLTRDGGLRTGDLGFVDRDGFVYVIGRIKEQYKLDNGRFVVPSPLETELRSSAVIKSVMLYGDGRPYNVALVVPDYEALRAWAEAERVYAPDRQALIEHPEVRAHFAREIEERSEGFRDYELVRDFRFLDRDFSTEDGTLTASSKIRRREVAARYVRLIDEMYGVHRGERAAVD